QTRITDCYTVVGETGDHPGCAFRKTPTASSSSAVLGVDARLPSARRDKLKRRSCHLVAVTCRPTGIPSLLSASTKSTGEARAAVVTRRRTGRSSSVHGDWPASSATVAIPNIVTTPRHFRTLAIFRPPQLVC